LINSYHHLLRRFYYLFPEGLRKSALRWVAGHYVAWRIRQRSSEPGPPIVAGLLGSASGLGQGSRYLLAGVRHLTGACRYVDLCDGFAWHRTLLPFGHHPPEKGQGGTLIVHINPPEFSLALAFLDRFNLANKRIIGYWTWELESMPSSWLKAFAWVDEVWVPSEFVARAIRNSGVRVPVHVVPYPLPPPEESPPDRGRFGLAPEDFVCLSLFDARSSVARKNPLGAVRAFVSAFGTAPDARLLLKAGHLDDFPEIRRQFYREIEPFENIRIIEETLSGPDVAKLMECADVVVSLHRSEGFGLVAAEAMLLGKPVVATGWSGNMDFMTPENSIPIGYELVPLVDPQGIYPADGERWAEPDTEAAARALRRLYADPDHRRRLGARAKADAAVFFGLERFRERVSERIPLSVDESKVG
jgi:glycosyltransferase involved in cell wall biosynthesis